ncbi:MAG: sigma-fimbria biosis chaperone protein [Pseudomonadota bacterium]|jgi:fimbrial chaperone protein
MTALQKIIHLSLLTGLLTSASAMAGNFAVSPIRLDFDRTTKTGVIAITNDDEDKLQIQMKAFEWTQDADGKDKYEETDDLIFFPKIATLEKGEQRLLRTSYKIPATEKQKTYRLFIEEIPGPQKAPVQGAQIAVAVRFGVPIFLKPLKEEVKGEVDSVKYADGKLNVKIKNAGNTHFFINNIQLKSGEKIAEDIKGWYLLNNAARSYSFAMTPQACSALGKFDIVVKTDIVEFTRPIDATIACAP